jgi:hypothetical protein
MPSASRTPIYNSKFGKYNRLQSLYSSVSIVTTQGLDGLRRYFSILCRGKIFISSPGRPGRIFGPHSPLPQTVSRKISHCKRAGFRSRPLTPACTDATNEYGHTSAPPCVCMTHHTRTGLPLIYEQFSAINISKSAKMKY